MLHQLPLADIANDKTILRKNRPSRRIDHRSRQHDADSQSADQGRLPVRLWLMLGEGDDVIASSLDQVRTIGYGNDHLTVRAIKRYVDGALGSRGALMLEPYHDQPDTTGKDPLQVFLFGLLCDQISAVRREMHEKKRGS